MNKKAHIQKFGKFRQINACMHWIHTCVTRNAQSSYPFCVNHALSAHLKTTQEDIFPGQLQLQKLNQLKPVLASAEFIKNLKFPTFCINFIHFLFEFLKDFYIFRILGPSVSFWYQQLNYSFSVNEEKYCLQEMVVSI